MFLFIGGRWLVATVPCGIDGIVRVFRDRRFFKSGSAGAGVARGQPVVRSVKFGGCFLQGCIRSLEGARNFSQPAGARPVSRACSACGRP